VTGVRYSAKVMARARELREAGWTYAQVADLLHQELGVRPWPETVAYWTSETRRRKHLHNSSVSKDRERRANGSAKVRQNVTETWKLLRIREMHSTGMSYGAIGKAAGVWWGEPLTRRQVRYLLVEKDERIAA
jgi:hypothetical protein